MATVHRVKGLEFDHVILAGKLDEMDAVDETSERFRQKRALLYVAATRARCSLFVCRLTP
jgi:superfamily I DNA/RNA helicase